MGGGGLQRCTAALCLIAEFLASLPLVFFFFFFFHTHPKSFHLPCSLSALVPAVLTQPNNDPLTNSLTPLSADPLDITRAPSYSIPQFTHHLLVTSLSAPHPFPALSSSALRLCYQCQSIHLSMAVIKQTCPPTHPQFPPSVSITVLCNTFPRSTGINRLSQNPPEPPSASFFVLFLEAGVHHNRLSTSPTQPFKIHKK